MNRQAPAGPRAMTRRSKAAGRLLSLTAMTAAILLAMQVPAPATPLGPVIDVQGQGLSIAEGGVGLDGLGDGTRSLTVSIGGPVQKALLVWAGRLFGQQLPSTPPLPDQELLFDGTRVVGTEIGREFDSIGYSADVTSIVQAKGTGSQTFTIADADLSKNLTRLNGGGLIILYTNASDTTVYRVTVADGLDFAFAGTPTLPAENRVTTPVVFTYEASPSSRTAELSLFVGDADTDPSGSTRPDSVKIDGVQSFVNLFNSSDGPFWDTDTVSINIPAASSSTSVEVVSGAVGVSGDPDSLLWPLTALRVPIPAGLRGCTPGFWKNHTSAWTGTGFSPSQTVGSVFTIPGSLSSVASKTLLQALDGGGGPGVLGAATILLRAAVAALLNSAHTGVNYPLTTSQVISAVNSALASNDRTTILSLATTLDNNNNLGCSL